MTAEIQFIVNAIERIEEKIDDKNKDHNDFETLVKIHLSEFNSLKDMQTEKHKSIEDRLIQNEKKIQDLDRFKNDLIYAKKIEDDLRDDKSWFRTKIHSLLYITIGIFILFEKVIPFLKTILRGFYESGNT